MYEHVKRLFSNELLLTQMEKCALMEALILVSNQFKDYNKQKAFLKELIAPVTAQWLSEEMRRYEWILFPRQMFAEFIKQIFI